MISDKVDFRISNVIRDKAWYYVVIKRSVHRENKNSSRKLKVYVPNNRASRKKKVIELQGELDKSTNLVGDFSTPSVIGRTSKHNLGKM